MATINYWLTQSLLNHDYNPSITNDLEGFSGEQWFPYHESMVSTAPVYTLTTHHPVEANGREIQYFKTNSYFDDYYNRIHIAPSALALGNVASEQVNAVTVWNAYFIPTTCMSIDD